MSYIVDFKNLMPVDEDPTTLEYVDYILKKERKIELQARPLETSLPGKILN